MKVTVNVPSLALKAPRFPYSYQDVIQERKKFTRSSHQNHKSTQKKGNSRRKNVSSKSGQSKEGGAGGDDGGSGGGDDGGDNDGDGDGHHPTIIFNGPITFNIYSSEPPREQREVARHNIASWTLNFLWDIFINILANIAATYVISLVLSLWAVT